MTAGERWARVPQRFLHATAMYGRLSAIEHVCLGTAMHFIWGWKSRAVAPIGHRAFMARAMGKSPESVRRAVAALYTPPTEVYQWGKGPSQRKQGHGILVLVTPAKMHQERVFAIETDYRRWGWKEGTDLDTVSAALATYDEPADRSWSADAKILAVTLRDSIRHRIGEAADVPPTGTSSREWCRWLDGMQSLLDRGYRPQVVSNVLYAACSDDFWGARLTGRRADQVLIRNFDELLIRSRRSR